MMRIPRFSTGNLVRVFVGASLLALGLFAGVVWLGWTGMIDAGRASVLRGDVRWLSEVYQQGGIGTVANAVDSQVGKKFGDRLHLIMLVTGPHHEKLAGNLATWPDGVSDREEIQHMRIRMRDGSIDADLLPHVLPGGYRLLVGRDVRRFDRLQDLFLFGLFVAAGIVSLVGFGGGWLVRRALLGQVQDINQATQAIMCGKLSHRLPVRSGEHELNVLVATKNRMLDQIETLVEGVTNVSNSIAHDLRTPLTELRARLEELVVTRPEPEQTFAELEGAIADVDRVIGIFNALLRMAQIDSGVCRAGFVQADAGAIAAQAAEFYQPLAELKGIELSFHGQDNLLVRGDPLLLAQAVGNLIDNAIKYGADGGRIDVCAATAGNVVEIMVADNGRGIPDDEKPKVFERFYRADASRHTAGAGLGLSLVAAIARLHDGALSLADNHPGLRATLGIPRAQVNEI